MNLIVDIIVCLLILFVVVGSRFNKWPAAQSKLFTGKPSEYIDSWRYWGFCFLYILTFFVISAVLYSFPEFLRFIPGAEEEQLSLSYTLCALIVVSALAHQSISSYDEQWRKQLHEWARIPRNVEEVSREIILSDSYMPTDTYLAALRKSLHSEDGSMTRWLDAIAQIEIEKVNHSIDWYFLKCFSLMLIIRDIRIGPSAYNLTGKETRIEELARLIPLAEAGDKEFMAYKKELETMSRYFIECICKYLIKKYPRADVQFCAFKNLGFKIRQHDTAEVSIREAIVWCALGVAFVSVVSVTSLLFILDERSERDFLTMERFIGWSLGNIECFLIAILVGLLVKKMSAGKARVSLNGYVFAFFLSTLASFIFFQFAQDLNRQSEHLPYARFILAMSFSSLTVVVIRSLGNINLDHKDVVVSSVVQGVMLGLVMAVFQVLASIAFTWDRVILPTSLTGFLMGDNWKYPMLALVGFGKGFFVGVGISYFIQETQRKQLMQTSRQNPRVERVVFLKCNSEGAEFSASTRDISKSGFKLQTRKPLRHGDKLVMESPVFGRVEGIIRWSHKLFWGRRQVGVQFTRTPLRLNAFLRDGYGEYYA